MIWGFHHILIVLLSVTLSFSPFLILEVSGENPTTLSISIVPNPALKGENPVTFSGFYPIDQYTAGYWSFEEGEGRLARDGGTNANDGELKNEPKWVNDTYGNALEFDGVNDYIEIDDDSSLDLVNGITIEAWINMDSLTGDYQVVVAKWYGGTQSYVLEFISNQRKFQLKMGNVGQCVSANEISLDTWHHVAGTYDGTEITIYLDGEEDNSCSRTGSINTGDSQLTIGAHDDAGDRNPFNGYIDNVRLSNIARDPDEFLLSRIEHEFIDYEWNSSLDGFLSNESTFTISSSVLSVGKHTITHRAQDTNGSWTKPVTIDLEVLPDWDDDGIIDTLDDFPYDPAASIDTDDDGYPDKWNAGKWHHDSTTDLRLDDHITDPAASLDTDDDGYPDEWNEGKSESDSTTGLTLDSFPKDPAASMDTDGDGYPDEWNAGRFLADSTTGLKLDVFPTNSKEWADSDGDGVGDNKDAFPTRSSLHAWWQLIAFIILIICVCGAVVVSTRAILNLSLDNTLKQLKAHVEKFNTVGWPHALEKQYLDPIRKTPKESHKILMQSIILAKEGLAIANIIEQSGATIDAAQSSIDFAHEVNLHPDTSGLDRAINDFQALEYETARLNAEAAYRISEALIESNRQAREALPVFRERLEASKGAIDISSLFD